MQIKKFNQSHPDIPVFIERIRATIEEYPGRFTVAEVGGPEPLAEMKAFTADGKRLDSAYNFDFLYAPEFTAERIKASLSNWEGAPGEGWPSWAFSNHDAPRSTTRWADDANYDQMARVAMMVLLSLRGNPIIYQGEELALPQGEVAFEDLLDPEAITNWPHTLGRDGSRTPFPWTRSAPQAGFSNANQTWLKVDPAQAERAVDSQTHSDGSALNHTRHLLALRRSLVPLVTGSSELLDTPEEMIAYIRRNDDEAVLCAYNLSAKACDWMPPAEFSQGALVASEAIGDGSTTLPGVMAPHSGYWAVKKGA